jgi:NAD(P)-dependent dehydrogenase (short-subunit alcohol dehydrogenase family)
LSALATGSASGLGAATAVALAGGGARVIVNYRTSAREVEKTADLCRTANSAVKSFRWMSRSTRNSAGSPPEDIAEVVTFLADAGSRHMAGSIVPVGF